MNRKHTLFVSFSVSPEICSFNSFAEQDAVSACKCYKMEMLHAKIKIKLLYSLLLVTLEDT